MVRQGELLEHAEVYDHGYGTPRRAVEAALSAGRDVLFDIDWQGTQQLRELAGEDRSPSSSCRPRPSSSSGACTTGGRTARRRSASGCPRSRPTSPTGPSTTTCVINSDLALSVQRTRAILVAERLKRRRQPGLADFVSQFRSPQPG